MFDIDTLLNKFSEPCLIFEYGNVSIMIFHNLFTFVISL